MINTDAPGVTVEVTTTVNYGPNRPAQVRLQSWAQADGDEHTHLVDLRLTVEQAMQLGHALLEATVEASRDNLTHD